MSHILADFDVALALSGGNALGAYQAGAYDALHERAIEPGHVAGASAGAINGALICGNHRDQRLAALRTLWKPASTRPGTRPGETRPTLHGPWALGEEMRRSAAAIATLTTGQAEIFLPRQLYGPWWNPLGNDERPSLFDTSVLRGTLGKLLDFGLLNAGQPRYAATAVDLESGEDVVFDTAFRTLSADHIRASAALIPAFSPVEIDGRLMGDAGMSANLPMDTILAELPNRPLLCIALDLLPLNSGAPRTLGEAAGRAQDLLFATQSRRSIAAWQAIFDERRHNGSTASATLLHLSYQDQDLEVAGKAFDFSAITAGQRWRAGYADMIGALDQIAAEDILSAAPGLTVYTQRADGTGGKRLIATRHSLAPQRR